MTTTGNEQLAALAVDCMHGILRGDHTITISVTGKRPPGFPRGELLSVGTNGSQNYATCPLKIMAWLHSATKGGRQYARAMAQSKETPHE